MKGRFRYFCGWLFASFLIATGFVKRAKRRALEGEFILSVYMHNPSKEEFEVYVRWLLKNGFEILSTSDLEKIIQYDLKFPKGAALLTVDDGWASNKANIVEVANKYKVPVTIFITTSAVENGVYWWTYILEAEKRGINCPSISLLKSVPNSVRLIEVNKIKDKIAIDREALTIDQLKIISESRYVSIGSHTHTHPILINCKEEQVFTELINSKKILESWLGHEVTSFAYPNGDYGEREINALQATGYSIAFNSDPEPLTLARFKNRYTIPRYGIFEGATFEENICRMLGVWKPITTRLKYPFYRKKNRATADVTPRQTFKGLEQESYKQYS